MTLKPPAFPKWTPPILGWQYELMTAGARGVGAATTVYQGRATDPYQVAINGFIKDGEYIRWHLFFHMPMPPLAALRFSTTHDGSLDAAIREFEMTLRTGLRSFRRLARDWGL